MSETKTFWLANVKFHRDSEFAKAAPAKCLDGFSVSIQASYGHYCTPRKTLRDGNYSAWELGYPSEVEPVLLPYAEDPKNPIDTVYGYVPTAVVDEVLKKHGGLKP